MRKSRRIDQNWLVIIIAMFLLAVGLVVFRLLDFFTTAEAVNIFLVAALVLVTALYAKESEKSRKATEEQAKATREMAEEMKEQRQSAVIPILVAECFPKTVKADGEHELLGVSVILRNIGLGPALDIGISLVEAPPQQIEYAWKEGKTAGISSFRTQFNLSELASGEDTAGNPKDIPDLHLIKNMKFTIVTECIDGYRNVIGAYRDFRVLEGERGKLLIEVTRTVSAQKGGHRIRSYP